MSVREVGSGPLSRDSGTAAFQGVARSSSPMNARSREWAPPMAFWIKVCSLATDNLCRVAR